MDKLKVKRFVLFFQGYRYYLLTLTLKKMKIYKKIYLSSLRKNLNQNHC